MKNFNTIFLPAYQILTVTTDAGSSGRYSFVIPGLQDTNVTAVNVSSSTVIGPFNTPKTVKIEWDKGQGTFAITPEISTNLAAVATSGLYTDLTITPELNLAVITNTATGTEIATAVNGIIAALIAKGLMAAAP